MPKSDNQKLKILYILDYLQKNSHEDLYAEYPQYLLRPENDLL